VRRESEETRNVFDVMLVKLPQHTRDPVLDLIITTVHKEHPGEFLGGREVPQGTRV
jgi:hypothetical protein